MNEMIPMENAPFPAANGELMNIDGHDYIADLTSATVAFSSMQADTPEARAHLYKAMNNPDARIGDCVNMKIVARDVYCEVVTVTNQDGVKSQVPRVVIIDVDGKSYQAVSMGVFSAIKKLFQVFGVPTWTDGLPLVVRQINKNDRRLLTFDVEM